MKMKLEDKILEHRRLHEMQPILEGVTSFFESLSKDYGFEERLGQAVIFVNTLLNANIAEYG